MWESCRAWLQLHEKAEIEDIKGSISWFQGVKICKKISRMASLILLLYKVLVDENICTKEVPMKVKIIMCPTDS